MQGETITQHCDICGGNHPTGACLPIGDKTEKKSGATSSAEQPERKGTAQLVPVEELIPGVKSADEKRPVGFVGLENDNTYANDLLRGVESQPEFRQFFKDFEGQIVVDLGAGSEPNDYKIVMAGGAKGYVAVEPNFGSSLSARIGKFIERENEKAESGPIPAAIVETDALTFLKRLPDKSVSVFSSGTEAEVMFENYPYIREVSKEIGRVLHPKGAFIAYDSAFTLNREDFEFERLNDKAAKARRHLSWPFEIYKPKAT